MNFTIDTYMRTQLSTNTPKLQPLAKKKYIYSQQVEQYLLRSGINTNLQPRFYDTCEACVQL